MKINRSRLDTLITVLNSITGNPARPHMDGKAQAGNYHLDGAYGRWALHQITEGGGSRDVLKCGYLTTRELFHRVSAYIDGWLDCQAVAKRAVRDLEQSL